MAPTRDFEGMWWYPGCLILHDENVPPSMTPRWMTIEKLVAELGGVCRSQQAAHAAAASERLPEATVDAAVERATQAVTSLVRDGSVDDDDSVVRDAWHAIAAAQDAIAGLRETIG